MFRHLPIVVCTLSLATNLHAATSDYLYIWAADADGKDSDFVAVLDAGPLSPTYGDLISTVQVGVVDPQRPTVESHFTDVGAFSYPHSFERLPNGNVLATFQNAQGTKDTVGGLVELSASGHLVRYQRR